MSIEQLCYYIDLYTDYGKDFPLSESWYEGIRLEEINLINNFSSDDWFILKKHIENKSNFWVECLLYILDEVDTPEARHMTIDIALYGTDENFLDAIEHIRHHEKYQVEIPQDTWIKLDARSNKVIRSKLGLKPLN